jgi:hypothetical protein
MLKKIAVAMVAAGGLMAATAPAHAAGHVSLSLGLPLPGVVYAAPAPAYYGPPAPVVYDTPQPAYYGPPPVYYGPEYYGPGYYGPRAVVRIGPGWHGGYYHHGWHR